MFPSAYCLFRPEYKPVIKPVVAHEQITGKLFVVEIGFCELRQVVTFFHDLVGEIFFIVILSLIFVLKVPYKVVRIFLAQIMAFVVAPHEKGFLFGVAQILHRIPQGEEIPGNPTFGNQILRDILVILKHKFRIFLVLVKLPAGFVKIFLVRIVRQVKPCPEQ